MKKSRIMFLAIFIVVGLISSVTIQGLRAKEENNKVKNVFFGPKEYKQTFDQSVTSAKPFYDLYGQARESVKAGDYETAIKLLNESLPHVGIGLEKGMVYVELAEIYRDIGNLEKELEYRELIPKFTMNEREKLNCKIRVEEIRSILTNPNSKRILSERFPEPPIYGRPFSSYREVVIAAGQSNELWRAGEALYRAGRYQEAIKNFKMAYTPDGSENSSIEYMLIKCYEKLEDYRSALALLDYTLARDTWGPDTRKELEQKRMAIVAHKS